MSDNPSIDFAGEVGKLCVLMERVLHEVQATNEGVAAIREKVDTLPTRAEFNELKQDVKTIKAAVTDTSRDLAEHKRMPADVAHGSRHARRRWWPA